jgi:hypothetical protein
MYLRKTVKYNKNSFKALSREKNRANNLRFEVEETTPTIKTLAIIANALEVDIKDLFEMEIRL